MLEHAGWRTAPFPVECFSQACGKVIPAGGRIYAVIPGPYDSYCEQCGRIVEVAVERKRTELGVCPSCGQGMMG